MIHYNYLVFWLNCAVPENIHTHPMDGHWKFEGGGGSKTKIVNGKYGT